ncbi:MAG: phage baseplate assembly protein V [Chloroflexota bacterium]|nr:phage baseplate assembly protein V [Chloroflexota bacterium]
MTTRQHGEGRSDQGDPLRTLLDALAAQADFVARYLERVYEEAYIESAEEQVSVVVDGQPWRRVTTFDGSGPDDPHYVLATREDGALVVEFGDGQRGRRPPVDGELRVRYARGSRRTSAELKPDRVVLDTPTGASSSHRAGASSEHGAAVHRPLAGGVHRALVVDANDPLMSARLLVQVPSVSGQQSLWALPCFAPRETADLPTAGETVWVLFESNDAAAPVWLGRLAARRG